MPIDNLSISTKLLENKLITPDQFDLIKNQLIQTGKKEEELVRLSKLVTEEELTKAKGEIYEVPYVSLEEKAVVPEVLSLLTKANAQNYHFFPFSFDHQSKKVSLAMANPLDGEAIKFVAAKTGYEVDPYITTQEQIDEAIEDNYTSNLVSDVAGALSEVEKGSVTEEKKINPTVKDRQPVRREFIAEIIDSILRYAVAYRASDIHIEPGENDSRVRYRIDGILQEKLQVSKKVHESLVSRIKILTESMKIDEKRVPQDGRFTFKSDDQEVDLRISTLPTVLGEKVVMRLLRKTVVVPTLSELGLRGLALKNLQDSILRPHGIILVCGPTGSGKTTTLYSVLTKINSPKVNISTLEDPVEYKMAGVNQVQINPAAGLTFSSGLRAFLRQDPNIIMVGEIRDSETAELAIQASLTGHLVFSTIHTKSAAQAVPRLMDMGAETFLLASTMTAIVSQRICRKVCQSCKEEYIPTDDVQADIKKVLGSLMPPLTDDKVKLFRGKGCNECGNTGYYGRVGIFEVLPITEKITRLIVSRAPAIDIEKVAVEEGMITMKQDGYLKVVEKLTTLEEVLRVAQD